MRMTDVFGGFGWMVGRVVCLAGSVADMVANARVYAHGRCVRRFSVVWWGGLFVWHGRLRIWFRTHVYMRMADVFGGFGWMVGLVVCLARSFCNARDRRCS